VAEAYVTLVDWPALSGNLLQLGTGSPVVSVAEKVVRSISVYVLLVIALRWFGKRILAQLNPFDLVVLLMLSNSVQNAIIGNDTSLTGGLIGAATLIAVNHLFVRFYYRGPRLEHRTREDDVYLIRDHAIQEPELRKLRINLGELTAVAHERGFDDIGEVEAAVLYPNGTIYMKGVSKDAADLAEILAQLHDLRGEVRLLRG
jgi:uncharacterized membrane protein YcaP (DUF421 family)